MKKVGMFAVILSVFVSTLFSQNQDTKRIFELHGRAVFLSTVGVRLTDSDVNTNQSYDNNEDYYVTLYDTNCHYPNRLTAVIDELSIHPSDTLYIYDGPDTTYPLLFKGNSTNAHLILYDDIYSSDNVMTIRMKTDSEYVATGFSFNIVCKKVCQEIKMSWDSTFYKLSSGELVERKVVWDFEEKEVYDSITGTFLGIDTTWFHAFDICLGDTIRASMKLDFPENDTYYHQSEESAYYSWHFGDGDTVSAYSLNEATHRYPIGQGHTMYVKAMDDRGCQAREFLPARVRIAKTPIHTVNNFPSVCYNTTTSISDSVALILPINFGLEASRKFDTRIFVPDGPNCPSRCYYSSVYFTNFPSGRKLESAEEICSICINMEHEYMGDISIALICPEGNRAILKYKDYEYIDPETGEIINPGGGGSSHYFGLPFGGGGHHNYNRDDHPCDSLYNIPGIGWNYCWSYNTEYGYWDTNGNNNSHFLNSIYINNNLRSVTHDFGDSLPPGYLITYNPAGEQSFMTTDSSSKSQNIGFYKPSEDFASLVGCSLNGRWDIEICDLYAEDNGWIFSWELEFCNINTNNDWGYRVGIDTIIWSEQSPNIVFNRETGEVSVPDTTGTYFFDLTVIDSFDCVWDTTVSITSVWTPRPELGSDTTFCNDSHIMLNADDGHANQNNYSYYWQPTGDSIRYIYTDSTRIGSTVYEVEVVNTIGFDSVKCIGRDSVIVTINMTYNDTIFAEICGGEVYDSYGFKEDETCIVTQYLNTEFGCDSLITLNLKVFPSYNDTINAVIGENEYYDKYGFFESMSGIYQKFLQTIDGCDSIVVLNLEVDGIDDLFIPNTFTPKGDINNKFYIKHSNNIGIKHVYIYTRAGELVFESENNAIAWDGTYKGRYCKQEVYTYLVLYYHTRTPNEIKSKFGTVLLLY